MRNYKNYDVWKRSHELTVFIYKEIIPSFPKTETYSLTSQMKRAAYSIGFNIVEGCGRSSNKGFVHFLDMALGSAHELEYCIFLVHELNFVDNEKYS